MLDPRLASIERTRTWATRAICGTGGDARRSIDRDDRPRSSTTAGVAEIFVAVGVKDVRADEVTERAADEDVGGEVIAPCEADG